MTWRPSWTPALFAAVAVAWTWPAAWSEQLYGRRADAAGTAWFVSAAPRLVHSLQDPLTGWPAGVHYARPDSWTLMAIGWATGGADAARVHALVGVIGVFVSAWAAEAFARRVGAEAPWSIVAGLGYACSGLASTAWIEGYTYHLADPWLPLLGLAWTRATGPEGRPVDGVAAAGAFGLALATTAWHGLGAALLVAGLLVGGRVRGELRRGPLLGAGLAVGVLLAVYLASFLGRAGVGADTLPVGGGLRDLAQRLVRHTAPVPSIDIDGRSQSAFVAPVVLALLAAAPVVLARERRWRTLALTGLVALAIPLVPWSPAYWATYVPASSKPVWDALASALTRFPDRIGWVWVLCAGAVAARVATRLAERRGRAAWPILALALVESFAGPRLPFRQAGAPAAVPSAYARSEGPVLDLWPEDLGPEPSWALRTTNTACYYQAVHRRPIADHCMLTPGVASPREVLGGWVTDRLLAGDADGVRAGLARLGFTSLAVHPDLFSPGDRARLAPALAALDPAPAASTDGGDHVVAYTIPDAAGAEAAAAAWAAWPGGAT